MCESCSIDMRWDGLQVCTKATHASQSSARTGMLLRDVGRSPISRRCMSCSLVHDLARKGIVHASWIRLTAYSGYGEPKVRCVQPKFTAQPHLSHLTTCVHLINRRVCRLEVG